MMELMKWKPNNDLFSLSRHMNRMFEDFFPQAHWGFEETGMGAWHPKVDMYEEDKTIVVKAELPGVDKNDISIDVKGRVLTLTGERSSDHETKEKTYFRKERYFGRFQRSFILPLDMDSEKISAEYKDGVLRIDIEKPVAQQPKKITVH